MLFEKTFKAQCELAFCIMVGVLALTFGLPACGGGSEDCPVGSEGCPCTGGGSCDEAFTCLSNRCVNPESGGDEGESEAEICQEMCETFRQCYPPLGFDFCLEGCDCDMCQQAMEACTEANQTPPDCGTLCNAPCRQICEAWSACLAGGRAPDEEFIDNTCVPDCRQGERDGAYLTCVGACLTASAECNQVGMAPLDCETLCRPNGH